MTEIPQIFTVKEIAQRMKCSARQVYQLIKEGELPAGRLAGKIVITGEALSWYMNEELRKSGGLVGTKDNGKPSPALAKSDEDLLLGQRRRRKLVASSIG